MIPPRARINTEPYQTRKHRPDYGLFVLSSILLAVGLIVMYAISPALAAKGGNVSDNYFIIRQLIAVFLGFIAFFVFSKVPVKFWQKIAKPLLVSVFILSILAVLTGGREDLRWIQAGPLSLQPVEFVKLVVVITFAGFLAKLASDGKLTDKKSWRVPLIIVAGLIATIVFLQRDLGSAVVLLSVGLAMLFVVGMPMKYFMISLALIVSVGVLAVISTPYRMQRVATFLSPTKDCSADESYHACQALIAVGSGGVMGVGLGRSIQAYGYLPEAENDSIFAIFAEKFGFIGSVVLLAIYGALLLRILTIMQRAPDRTSQLIVAGVFTWFSVQALINIAAMLGLIPIKGITLPFISYGGTSLLFSMAALGMVFQISRYTSLRKIVYNYEPKKEQPNESDRHWRGNSRPRYTVTRRSI